MDPLVVRWKRRSSAPSPWLVSQPSGPRVFRPAALSLIGRRPYYPNELEFIPENRWPPGPFRLVSQRVLQFSYGPSCAEIQNTVPLHLEREQKHFCRILHEGDGRDPLLKHSMLVWRRKARCLRSLCDFYKLSSGSTRPGHEASPGKSLRMNISISSWACPNKPNRRVMRFRVSRYSRIGPTRIPPKSREHPKKWRQPIFASLHEFAIACSCSITCPLTRLIDFVLKWRWRSSRNQASLVVAHR